MAQYPEFYSFNKYMLEHSDLQAYIDLQPCVQKKSILESQVVPSKSNALHDVRQWDETVIVPFSLMLSKIRNSIGNSISQIIKDKDRSQTLPCINVYGKNRSYDAALLDVLENDFVLFINSDAPSDFTQSFANRLEIHDADCEPLICILPNKSIVSGVSIVLKNHRILQINTKTQLLPDVNVRIIINDAPVNRIDEAIHSHRRMNKTT